MSEGGGGSGPEIGPTYQNAAGPTTYSNPPSQPPTPSSTVQDPPSYHSVEVSENSNDSKPNITNLHSNSNSGLPPFSSFAASDVNEGLGGRLAGDGYLTSDGISSTRVMELSGWDYCYTDGLSGRYLERGDSMPVMIPQPQYRPWESKQDGSSDSNKSTLPSFQSQFGEELVTTLTTLTPAACSPAPSVQSPSLPSFHTLSAVNPRYPLVPAPVQAREIPSIQQQFLDERHIHLFQGPPGQNFALQPQNGLNGQTLTSLNNGTTLTTLNNAQYHPQIINNAQILPSGQIITPQSHHLLAPTSQIITSNGHIISSSGSQGLTVVSQNSTPTVLTVVKTEPVNIVELKSSSSESSNLTQLHHTNFQNPLITQGQQMDSKFGLESPPRGVDGRKKERRKIRASSLESSNESDGAMSVESSGQVAAVSSTAGFKSPMTPGQITNEGDGMIADTGEKQTKKKRKRCGECIGCQRKDNCGDCAPCRNDKSHQICKMRRCEKLTEKKHLLAYNREDGGVSYRGRGRGRGRGSRGGCRGKAARPGAHSAQVTSVVTEMNSTPGLVVGSGRDNVKIESGRVSSGSIPANSNLTPTMAVPFYAGTEVWPASSPADPWTAQGQFIHQIDDIRYQHYPGYQAAGYQQTGFITDQTSAFQPQYTNSSNGNPSTSPAQGNVTPRSSGSYTQVHTPTPSPNPSSTPHVNGHRNGINVHYIEENYVNGTTYNTDANMVPPASTTPNSRSSSGQLEETNSKTTNYMPGNEIPGYPQNSPQCQSSCNSSGYPGQSLQSEYGDQSNETSYQINANHANQKSPSYAQASPGTYQSYQNFNQISPEQRQKSPKPGTSPGSCHPSQKPSGMYPQNSPNSNPSPQSYQQISPGQSRNAGHPGNGNMYMDQQRHFGDGYSGQSPQHFNSEFASQGYSPSQDKSTVNARIKSMIMNKHQMSQNRPNSNYSASSENHLASPGREMMSPNHQMTQNSPMQNQMMSPSNQQQLISNSSPNSKEPTEKKPQGQVNENANHFLAFSHHLRDGRVLQPEGGGVRNWADPIGPNQFKKTARHNDSISAMESFMKFASAEFEKTDLEARRAFPQRFVCNSNISDPIRNLEANFPTKRNVNSTGSPCDKFESFARQKDCRDKSPIYWSELFGCKTAKGRSSSGCANYNQNSAAGYADYFPQNWGVKTETAKSEEPEAAADPLRPKLEPPDNFSMRCDRFDPNADGNADGSPYQRISYAPNAPKMEVIDLRFVKKESVNREKWEEYQKATEKERSEVPKKESYRHEGDGGPIVLEDCVGAWCCRRGGTERPTQEHLRDGCCQGLQTADEIPPEKEVSNEKSAEGSAPASSADSPKAEEKTCKSPCAEPGKEFQDNVDRLKNNIRSDVPDCQCFPPDKCPPEPGSYYTHLGAAASLLDLRKDVETRTGQTGKALRIEKICYTGKEGKTTQGCPLAKWVIRRSSIDEKFLVVVKHRQGHTCSTAWIVVCLVAWEGVPSSEADRVYSLLSHKLNRFGLPTTRRCATNEPRTCACQGLDPDTCGASFSFGCSWSMYYNGCKYARSKTVRKFRLSVRSEEQEVEERMHVLATLLSPLYSTLAPEAFQNQTTFEREASECRLGFKPGRPFSGVTACIDFCAHSHRDLHNMNNGCTVVVSLTKHRTMSKPEDEQLHVLPLYIMDETDEYGCKESQEAKYKDGSIERLKKFPCEVRVRAVPLQPCRRHGKKRKDDEIDAVISTGKAKDMLLKNASPVLGNNVSPMHCLELPSLLEGMDCQLQSSQVSSTVMDSPVGMYQGWGYHGMSENDSYNADGQWNKAWPAADVARKQTWMNPSSQWDYSGYFPDRDVDPDSTTMQNQNSVGCSNLVAGSFQSNASWQQQVTDARGHNLPFEDSKLGLQCKKEPRPVRNGKNSPQNWSDYPVTQSPSDSVFRIPKGRPPSRPNPAPTSTDSDHFLKPFPKDNQSITSARADCSEAGKHWPTNRSEAFQNAYNSNQNAFNQQCQTGGYEVQSYNWNYPEYQEDRFGYNQNFPPAPERWDLYGPGPFFPLVPETPKSEPIGEVTDYIENEECFRDSQMGGVAIALGHGSVLFECAKHELHATTALRRPNRLHPTRISLVFYQHRNLNRAKHGWDEWEEKMRLRKLGINVTPDKKDAKNPEETEVLKLAGLERPLGLGERMLVRVPTYTTTTWTTLFPMRPCMVTGPYQEGGND